MNTSVEPSPLLIANRFYVMQGFQIKKTFKDDLNKFFDFDIENVNFADSDASALFINQFVEQKTKSKIKNIIARDSIDDDTRLIAVNAIYFKADWEKPFEKFRTREGDFYIDEVKKGQVYSTSHFWKIWMQVYWK